MFEHYISVSFPVQILQNCTNIVYCIAIYINIYIFDHIWASCLPFKMPGLHSILDKPAKVNIESILGVSNNTWTVRCLPCIHLTESSTDFSDQLLDRAKPCWAIACTLRWKEADSACSRQKKTNNRAAEGTLKERERSQVNTVQRRY